MEKIISEMEKNSTDFYDQVAGTALRLLFQVYGNSLSRNDVNRVIEQLNGAANQIGLPDNTQSVVDPKIQIAQKELERRFADRKFKPVGDWIKDDDTRYSRVILPSGNEIPSCFVVRFAAGTNQLISSGCLI